MTTLAQDDNTPDNRSKHTDKRETPYLKHDRGGPASQDHDKTDKRDTEVKKMRKEEQGKKQKIERNNERDHEGTPETPPANGYWAARSRD
jgi:hypothetical protein